MKHKNVWQASRMAEGAHIQRVVGCGISKLRISERFENIAGQLLTQVFVKKTLKSNTT